MSGLGFKQSVDQMVQQAVQAMDLDPSIAEAIRSCNAILQVSFPVEIRGKIEMFSGWRAVHSTHRLPSKGGIRYAPEVDIEEITAKKILKNPSFEIIKK